MSTLETNVKGTWNLLKQSAGVLELRALLKSPNRSKAWDGWGEVVSGYFDNCDAFTECVVALEKSKQAKGIYVTLNPVDKALLGRAKNKLIAAGKRTPTTSDDDIICRMALLIDADPFRPAEISSSNDEMAAAIAKRDEVAEYLYSLGFPLFHKANSGNGAHLIGKIDLPNDNAAKQLVNDFLECLNWKFGTVPSDSHEAKLQFRNGVTNVGIDTTVFNASRITKLYGTSVRKGDDIEDRPHRDAELTFIPESPEVIPAELLEQLAEEYRQHKAGQQPTKTTTGGHTRSTTPEWSQTVDGVEQWLNEHGATLGDRDIYTSDGYQYKWDVDCLTCGGVHKDGAVIMWGANKGLGYKCHHNGCKGKGWADVRSLIAPKAPYTPEPQDDYDGFAPEAPEMPLRSAPIASKPKATSKTPKAQPEATEAPTKEDSVINPATWPYAVKDGRIIQYEKTKHGVNERPLCNFNAWITADIEVNDGEDIMRKVVIAGKLYDGQPLSDIELNAKEFESMDWCVTNWGARVSIEPGRGTKDTLRHAIQTLSAHNMEQKSSRSHTGWAMVDGKRVFLHGGGAVGQDSVDVSLPAQLRNYTLPNDHDIDATTAMIESLALLEVAPMRISAPLWATMYLGPLSELITPAFVVSVEGGSGSLKSSYSAVMLNHFGKKFHEYAMPADWLATANSLEKLAFHAKDIPLIIDDFRPTTSATEGKALMDSVSRIVRATGNRQGRMRLDAESGFKRTYAPRGVVVMTAERKAMGKSVNSRIITIDVEPNDVNKLRLATAQKQRHIYGYAMAGYIEWVAANWEDLAQELPRLVADTRAANGGNGHHLRLPNATAVLYAAFHTAMRYAVHTGAIAQDDAELLKSNCYEALQELAELQNQATDAEDPATKFLTIIATLTAQNKVYLPSKSGMLDLGSAAGDRLGWHDEHELFLLPAAYNTVYQYARNEGWTFPSDENTLRKELKRGGYLARTDGDRFTIKRRDPGSQKPSNVLAIKFDKFAEILSTMSDDEVSRRLDAVAVVAAVVDGL